MAWIESHQGLARHIKTKRLARKLNTNVPAIIGHLHLLWWWAMDNIPDGCLSSLEADDIAEEMMWESDSEFLVSAMIEVGFLDETEEGIFIHDWHDYVGKLIDKRKSDAERKRMSRTKSESRPKDVQRMSSGQVMDDPSDGAGNSTVQYSTEHNNTKDIKPLSDKSNIAYVEIIDYLNEQAGTKFKHSTASTQKHIKARWNEKFTLDDFKSVIDTKVKEWKGTSMDKYIRPETLFGTKFEGYLNEKGMMNNGKHGGYPQANASEDRESPYAFLDENKKRTSTVDDDPTIF